MQARVSKTIPIGSARNNCYLCNRAQRLRGDALEPMIATGVHIEWEGELAFCATCIGHMGKMLGLLTPDDVEALAAELTEVLEARVAQERYIEELERRMEALRTLLGNELAGEPVERPEPEPAPEPEVSLVEQGLAVLDEIRAERAGAPDEGLAAHVAPEWREGDGPDEAFARERAAAGGVE